MRESLMVIGLIVLALALRCARTPYLRKLGVLIFLVASFCLIFFLTDSVVAGSAGILIWFFLPWFELLTRIRRMRLPFDNRLHHLSIPNPLFFPNATEAASAMEEEGFEHVSDCGWEWNGMHQFFRLFWHPEERAVAAVCLCEHSDVTFAFISLTSHDDDGKCWRTTNFPFATTLLTTPNMNCNHLPCGRNCFHHILRDHREYISKSIAPESNLLMPDPEEIEASIEREMHNQLNHNLEVGIIRLTDDGHFRYSLRGLFFLWGQFIKDMVRFC